jgi:hypothetical protein
MQSDWSIVKRGWEAHVLGEAPHKFTDPVEAVETLKVLPKTLLKLPRDYFTNPVEADNLEVLLLESEL